MDENRQLSASKGNKGAREYASALGLSAKTMLKGLDPAQRKWLAVAATFSLLCFFGILWYATRTDWRTLYAGLDTEDSREMATQLTAASIPYDVSPDGTALRVPAESLDKARLATTQKGGPRSGRMGFDLFDKPNWVGSEFDEKVNYQRALEGELEHTINTLADVESSRVHLVMPHDSLFNEQQRDAKASVVLKLRKRLMSEEEADSVRNLVASAVDDLHPGNVVLIDSLGRQVGRKNGSAEVEAHEQLLAAKLVETLEPAAGVGNVHASVNVEYDTATADEVDETYDPSNVVTLSMQRSEQIAGGQPIVAGIPGTASNAPNVQPPLYPKSTSEAQSEKQESSTYGASKKVRHITQGAGKLRRLTAAILVNQLRIVNGKQVSWRPRSPEEMRHFTDLARAAIGFDSSRGDVVSVEDLPFEDEIPATPLEERLVRVMADSQPLIKFAIILFAMTMLLIFVVRPMMRKVRSAQTMRALTAGKDPAAGIGPQALEADPSHLAAEKERVHAQVMFDSVAEHVRREPVQSTRLLQSWIHTE